MDQIPSFLQERNFDANNVIRLAVEQHKPTHIFGLFSGGHDSLVACHLLSQFDNYKFNVRQPWSVVHINTGIGVRQTREFIRLVCDRFNWTLREYEPPESYESLVVKYGFPGPGHHPKMYQRLKERCLCQIMRETRDRTGRNRVLFISGRRRTESVRRMANVIDPIQRGPKPSGRAVWVNPIIDWTTKDRKAYMKKHGLPVNPVVQKLCMSGECLCGAFAQPGELDVIRGFYPDAAEEIDRISEKVKVAGKHYEWGTRPAARTKYSNRQLSLCFSCEAKYDGES